MQRVAVGWREFWYPKQDTATRFVPSCPGSRKEAFQMSLLYCRCLALRRSTTGFESEYVPPHLRSPRQVRYDAWAKIEVWSETVRMLPNLWYRICRRLIRAQSAMRGWRNMPERRQPLPTL